MEIGTLVRCRHTATSPDLPTGFGIVTKNLQGKIVYVRWIDYQTNKSRPINTRWLEVVNEVQ